MASDAWWAVALSTAVQGDRSTPVVCDGEELVLFRDAAGQAWALEDRCPHRRVPLSLGVVKPLGLQCAYHGWTFDGATGQCTAIPNLRDNEKVPPRYGVKTYPVREAGGFVHVWLGQQTPDQTTETHLLGTQLPAGTGHWHGSALVSLPHDDYLAAMLDGPQTLMAFDGVEMTDFFLGDARNADGWLSIDRGAVWRTRRVATPYFVVDHPLIVRTAVSLQGGAVQVSLLDANEHPLASVLIGTAAHRRGTTAVCWQAVQHDAAALARPWRWRLARARQRPIATVLTQLDAKALAALPMAPSHAFRRARIAPAGTPSRRAA